MFLFISHGSFASECGDELLIPITGLEARIFSQSLPGFVASAPQFQRNQIAILKLGYLTHRAILLKNGKAYLITKHSNPGKRADGTLEYHELTAIDGRVRYQTSTEDVGPRIEFGKAFLIPTLLTGRANANVYSLKETENKFLDDCLTSIRGEIPAAGALPKALHLEQMSWDGRAKVNYFGGIPARGFAALLAIALSFSSVGVGTPSAIDGSIVSPVARLRERPALRAFENLKKAPASDLYVIRDIFTKQLKYGKNGSELYWPDIISGNPQDRLNVEHEQLILLDQVTQEWKTFLNDPTAQQKWVNDLRRVSIVAPSNGRFIFDRNLFQQIFPKTKISSQEIYKIEDLGRMIDSLPPALQLQAEKNLELRINELIASDSSLSSSAALKSLFPTMGSTTSAWGSSLIQEQPNYGGKSKEYLTELASLIQERTDLTNQQKQKLLNFVKSTGKFYFRPIDQYHEGIALTAEEYTKTKTPEEVQKLITEITGPVNYRDDRARKDLASQLAEQQTNPK